MADQLSLRLEADLLPELPDLRPMLPRPLPEPFDSDEHLFEPWWGGGRVLVGIGPAEQAGSGEVRVVDADGTDLSAALPELAGMAVRVAARSALLDGELVVVDADGRADARRARAPRFAGSDGPPAAFLAFDLLHLDGRSLLAAAARQAARGAPPRAPARATRWSRSRRSPRRAAPSTTPRSPRASRGSSPDSG